MEEQRVGRSLMRRREGRNKGPIASAREVGSGGGYPKREEEGRKK